MPEEYKLGQTQLHW